MSKSAGTYAFATTVTQVDSPAIGPGDLVIRFILRRKYE